MRNKKTVLISGSSRGIGYATAITFARKGYAVGVQYHHSAREAEKLVALLNENGCHAVALQGDVSSETDAMRIAAEAERALGRITTLVNNAGVALIKPFADTTAADWRSVLGVSLDGAYHLTRAVLPQMLAADGGSIINVSSIWGVTGASCEAAYSAAKAGVIGLTRALAKELGSSQIRVNAVAPGVIDTDMNHALSGEVLEQLKQATPLGRIGTPQEVADVICFLASSDAAFVTGQVLGVDGGFGC